MLKLQKKGAVVFDYGNNIRGEALANGVKKAFDIPGFCTEYIRPLFCDGRARSGGRRCRAILRTSIEPTQRGDGNVFPTTHRFATG